MSFGFPQTANERELFKRTNELAEKLRIVTEALAGRIAELEEWADFWDPSATQPSPPKVSRWRKWWRALNPAAW